MALVLPPTQIVEGVESGTNLLTDFGYRVDVLESVNQRSIFGAQFFSQFVNSLKQVIEFLGISLLVGLLHPVAELTHFAIDSGLGLVAADYFEDPLRVRLGHLRRGRRLRLRTWRGSDHKNGKNYPQVSIMPSPAMMPDLTK